MLTADFFARFGFFVARDFLDRESCTRLRREMKSSDLTHVSIGDRGGDVLDEESRAAAWANVSRCSTTSVRRRLLELKPRLQAHFQLQLRDCQPPQFLVYREGDFYVAHSDRGSEVESPQYVSERRVSAVVFLNSPSEEDRTSSYQGGTLTFSGVIDDPRLESSVYPLAAETGLLVAFRSDVLHGVTPVTRGERYTIVSWYT